MRRCGMVLAGTVLAALWTLDSACGPTTIEEPTATPEVTPAGTPTFAPGPDVDQDGYGANEECDDTYDETYPGAEETCDGRDNDCDGKIDNRDIDGDGYVAEACGGEDCDDQDSLINPGVPESCNDIDENCNGEVDEGTFTTFYIDRDQDDYGDPKVSVESCVAPSGYVTNDEDCRDQDPDVHPGQPELCNGLDDDCNGLIDDGLELTAYYPDADQDGFGDADSPPFQTCDQSPPGYVLNDEDCDDTNGAVHPGATEVCNGLDDDCDGFTDQDDPEGTTGYSTFYRDRDGDGYGVESPTQEGCTAPAGYAGTPGDCDDTRSDVYPDAEEACDAVDNDCDGERDESFSRTAYQLDNDGDGFGSEQIMACADLADPAGANLVTARGDCDDASSKAYPGAADVPGDGTDTDCGGSDGPDPHVGLSDTSLASLQSALDAATPGATVWVGPGSYLEAEIDFHGKAVQLRSTQGPETTLVDAGGGGTVVLFQSGEDEETVLDGFSLSGGTATEGGGIFLFYSSPSIAWCTIEDNQADYGAGMFLFGAAPALSRLSIGNNDATTEGGGVYMKSSTATLVDVTITDNITAGQGGGICLRASSPTMEDVVVSGNDADLGGGAYLASGSAPIASHLQVTGNTASKGAGLYLDSASPSLTNCTIAANVAGGDGGGGYFKSSSPILANVWVAENIAANFGGGLALSSSNPAADNLVVSDNTAPYGAGIYLSASSPTLRHPLVIRNDSNGQGGGVYVIETGSAPDIENGIIAYNTGYNVYNHPAYPGSPQIRYTILYAPDGSGNHNLESTDETVREIEPGFLSYQGGEPASWHLATDSPAADSGAPGTADPDGSPADLGAFGGPFGDGWDLDADGRPAYFWPGIPADAPQGYDPGDYDLDDGDPLQ